MRIVNFHTMAGMPDGTLFCEINDYGAEPLSCVSYQQTEGEYCFFIRPWFKIDIGQDENLYTTDPKDLDRVTGSFRFPEQNECYKHGRGHGPDEYDAHRFVVFDREDILELCDMLRKQADRLPSRGGDQS
jgi:hypothetical protein